MQRAKKRLYAVMWHLGRRMGSACLAWEVKRLCRATRLNLHLANKSPHKRLVTCYLFAVFQSSFRQVYMKSTTTTTTTYNRLHLGISAAVTGAGIFRDSPLSVVRRCFQGGVTGSFHQQSRDGISRKCRDLGGNLPFHFPMFTWCG